MDPSTKDSMSQLDELLGASNQAWLLGAGISRDAGIPLMGPLTEQVFKRASDDGEENDKAVLDQIKSQLTEGCHIEHILSQIGDLRAIAERSRIKTVDFGTVAFTLDELDHFHQRILTWIAETVRWGYCPKSGGQEEMIGTRDLPIVSVKDHSEFVASLFTERQKGLSERRRAVKLFTSRRCSRLILPTVLGRFHRWCRGIPKLPLWRERTWTRVSRSRCQITWINRLAPL
jgi:hypothetical protein